MSKIKQPIKTILMVGATILATPFILAIMFPGAVAMFWEFLKEGAYPDPLAPVAPQYK